MKRARFPECDFNTLRWLRLTDTVDLVGGRQRGLGTFH